MTDEHNFKIKQNQDNNIYFTTRHSLNSSLTLHLHLFNVHIFLIFQNIFYRFYKMSFSVADIRSLANLLKQPEEDSDSDGEQVSLYK